MRVMRQILAINATLNWFRYNASPPTLKTRTSHNTVLHGEETKKQGVYQNRLTERSRLAGVY
jgi:hypothetical protein